jgi:hypothetical protein
MGCRKKLFILCFGDSSYQSDKKSEIESFSVVCLGSRKELLFIHLFRAAIFLILLVVLLLVFSHCKKWNRGFGIRRRSLQTCDNDEYDGERERFSVLFEDLI